MASKLINAAILKVIKVSKYCHGKFTAKSRLYKVQSNLMQRKNVIEFYNHLFKDLSSMLYQSTRSPLPALELKGGCNNYLSNILEDLRPLLLNHGFRFKMLSDSNQTFRL